MKKTLLGVALSMSYMHSAAQLSDQYYIPQIGLSVAQAVICDLTGKETFYYVPLMFSGDKQVDEDVYNDIKGEFDSVMQAAFNSFWDTKYAEYNGTRVENEDERRKAKIEIARIGVLKAQFMYNDEVGAPNDSLLIEEYCKLCEKHNIFFPSYCGESSLIFGGQYFFKPDSTSFLGRSLKKT